MPPAGLEPTFLASELPQIHTLDRAATGIGFTLLSFIKIPLSSLQQVIQSVETLAANNKQAISSPSPQKLVYCDQFNTSLTLRRLMSYIYIYGAPILDVSRSHTTTQHSR